MATFRASQSGFKHMANDDLENPNMSEQNSETISIANSRYSEHTRSKQLIITSR